jgi:hypothetical protein
VAFHNVWSHSFLVQTRKNRICKPAIVSDFKMDILNYIAYMDGHHRFMFDAENLMKVLSDAGLMDVRIRDFPSWICSNANTSPFMLLE